MLDTDYAGFWPRVAASIVDSIIITIPSWIIVFLDSSGIGGIAFCLLYYAGFEGSNKQATLGKQVMNLRVADKNGNRVSFLRVLARAGLMLIIPMIFSLSIMILIAVFFPNTSEDNLITSVVLAYFAGFYLSCLFVCWTPKKQGLHDIFSGCIIYKHDKKFEQRQIKDNEEFQVEPTVKI